MVPFPKGERGGRGWAMPNLESLADVHPTFTPADGYIKRYEELMSKQPTGALKEDSEKTRVELVSFTGLEEIGKVLATGAKKYEADNWRKGFAWRRLIGALLRHTFAFARGEDFDPETGLSHMAHAGCCVLFLLEHQLCGLGQDDRHKEARK